MEQRDEALVAVVVLDVALGLVEAEREERETERQEASTDVASQGDREREDVYCRACAPQFGLNIASLCLS